MAVITSGLPVRLAPGILSIYGNGSVQGISLLNNTDLAFGVIYQLDDNSASKYSVGQNVLLPYKEAGVIIYQQQSYWLIPESKIILVENTPDIS